jgi:hypothetical protein
VEEFDDTAWFDALEIRAKSLSARVFQLIFKKNKKNFRKGVDRGKWKWFLGGTPGNGWIFGRIFEKICSSPRTKLCSIDLNFVVQVRLC